MAPIDGRLIEVLSQVEHPIRYLGGEYNCPKRSRGPNQVRFALIYPDLYELGLSNYGLKIIYHILARRKDVFVDRAYAPWPDFGTALRTRGLHLYGVESKIGLRDFDILGFSLQSELCYTNLLYILDLAGIPIESRERDPTHPLVIAGGPCCYNPLPMARFVDCFVVGDGEEVVEELVDAYKEWDRRDRGELLSGLGEIEGVWVPSAHGRGVPIHKRVVRSLRYEDYPVPILPICQIIHDRLTVEVSRGCARGCRFCQAGMVNRPVRSRPPEEVVRLAREGVAATGWEEISLLSLSVLDYPELGNLLSMLNLALAEDRVSISVASLRGECFNEGVAKLLAQVKRTGLTFAPETASERLQRRINKLVNRDQLLRAIECALGHGWSGVKLYFMIGLPGETDEDLREVGRLVEEVRALAKGASIRITVSPFIPKPHTPFQWAQFCGLSELISKVELLRAELPRRGIKVMWHPPERSYLEAALSRGGEGLAQVVLKVYEMGGVLQEWSEFFDFGRWLRAFEAAGIDPQEYLKERELEAPLEWEFIDPMLPPGFLRSEYLKSIEGQPSGGYWPITGMDLKEGPSLIISRGRGRGSRFRVRYGVDGNYRYAGHLDRVRAIYRALRRSGLPILYTQGYSPHPLVSFGPPLPVGVSSRAEYLDLLLNGYDGDLIQDLNRVLPEGLTGLGFRRLAPTTPSLGRSIELLKYLIRSPDKVTAPHPSSAGVYKLEQIGPETILIWLRFAPKVRLFSVLEEMFGPSSRGWEVERLEAYQLRDGRLCTPMEEV